MDCSLLNMDALTRHMGQSFGMKHSGCTIFVPHMHLYTIMGMGFVKLSNGFMHEWHMGTVSNGFGTSGMDGSGAFSATMFMKLGGPPWAATHSAPALVSKA